MLLDPGRVSLMSPLLGPAAAPVFGSVYRRLFGTVGVLAAQNALRNPRRTGATASALMIGLALMALMSIFGSPPRPAPTPRSARR